MGTKRQLAGFVNDITLRSSPGVFLDLFCGMGAVASTIANTRQVWTNDLQYFSHECSLAHFCSQGEPLSRLDAAAVIADSYSEHTRAHLAIASSRIEDEQSGLTSSELGFLTRVYDAWTDKGPLQDWRASKTEDATLFRDSFAGSYFGLSQAIEIDALRFAFDKAYGCGTINKDQHRWLLLALCVAVSKCSTSTGHFAQPLTVKPSNLRWFTAQRRRSIRDTCMQAIEQLRPTGSQEWRQRNCAMRHDAASCITHIRDNDAEQPAIVYADPPYTDDQYSRYYHVYETLIRYDYPEAIGRGRYRSDREVSNFSLKASVLNSITALIKATSDLGADLILSYPTNGLLKNSRCVIPEIIQQAYGRPAEVMEIEHQHSTMGGSKGEGKQAVTEVIYRAHH